MAGWEGFTPLAALPDVVLYLALCLALVPLYLAGQAAWSWIQRRKGTRS